MSVRRCMPAIQGVMLVLILCPLLGAAVPARAEEAPEAVLKAIERAFPNATITEIEEGVWKGHTVLEVDLTTQDGTDYEVLVSERGQILNIEEEEGLPWIGGELSVGVAGMIETEIYKGVDTEFQPVPYFHYENDWLEIGGEDGMSATWTFYRTGPFSMGVTGYVSMGEGYDPGDSKYLKGMDELDTLYGAGMTFEWEYSGFEASVEFLQDVSGEHDGQEVEVAVAYEWKVAGFELRPQMSFTWMSEDVVDYLYGVSSSEARVDRPKYSPGSSYEVGPELMIKRELFWDLTFVGIAGATMYGSEITDSPLVDEDYSITGIVGLMYTF